MNYKEVFQLAQDKAYILQVPFIISLYEDGRPDLYEFAEYNAGLCELTLIQKWLRDEQGVYVQIGYLSPPSYVFYFYPCLEKGVKIKNARVEGRKVFDTYEETLLNGCYEALKLIK